MSINRTQWAYRSKGIGKKNHIHTLQSKEGIDRARREWHEEQGTSKIPSEVTLQFQLLSFLLTSCVCVFRLSQWESDSLQPYGLLPARLLRPWDLSMQEYWSGLPFPSLGDLLDPGIELASLSSPSLADGFSTTVPPGKKPVCIWKLKSPLIFIWRKMPFLKMKLKESLY